MNRTRMFAVIGVFVGVATMGCSVRTSSTEATQESDEIARRVHEVTGDEHTAAADDALAQELELKSHTNSDGQGPHPEPWLDTANPHPEPWQQPISSQPTNPGGTQGSGGDNGKP